MIDKSDTAAIQAAQQAGIAIGDDGELVGETDGMWGVGGLEYTLILGCKELSCHLSVT